MREVISLRSDVEAFRQLVLMPPLPKWVEDKIVPSRLASIGYSSRRTGISIALVFISEDCPSCSKLIAEISVSDVDARDVVFVTRNVKSDRLMTLVEPLGSSLIQDEDGTLFGDAGIYGTPTAIIMRDGEIVAYEPGANAEWISSHLAEKAAASQS